MFGEKDNGLSTTAGARDLLPLDVVQKTLIEDRLQQVFHRWGYHRLSLQLWSG